jgi:hypothetical protein
MVDPGLFKFALALGAEVFHHPFELAGTQSLFSHGLASLEPPWAPSGSICGKVAPVNQKKDPGLQVTGLTAALATLLLGWGRPLLPWEALPLAPLELIFPPLLVAVVIVQRHHLAEVFFQLRHFLPHALALACATFLSELAWPNTAFALAKSAYLFGLALLFALFMKAPASVRGIQAGILGGAALIVALFVLGVAASLLFPQGSTDHFLRAGAGSMPAGFLIRFRLSFGWPAQLVSYITFLIPLFWWASQGRMSASIRMGGVIALCGVGFFTLAPGVGAMLFAVALVYSRPFNAPAAAHGSGGKKHLARVGVFIALLFVAAAFSFSPTHLARGEFSPSARLSIATASWRAFLENPLFGWGPGARPLNVLHLSGDGTTLHAFSEAHIAAFSVAHQSGLFGLCALVFFIVQLARTSRWQGQSNGAARALWIALLCGWAMGGLTNAIEDQRHLWAILGMIAGLNTGKKSMASTRLTSGKRGIGVLAIGVLFAAPLLTGCPDPNPQEKDAAHADPQSPQPHTASSESSASSASSASSTSSTSSTSSASGAEHKKTVASGPSPRKRLPKRRGNAPRLEDRSASVLSERWQLDQNAPPNLQRLVAERATALPGVQSEGEKASGAVHPRLLVEGRTIAEFSNVKDGSLKVSLPGAWAEEAVAKGWGRALQVENEVRLYGPRDGDELEVLLFLLGKAAAGAHPEAKDVKVDAREEKTP